MKKSIVFASLVALPGLMLAQSAIDAYRLSQPDLKGTARFMGMAGAFTALGGDLSTISQNPAGIGVFRKNDIGFTLNLDCQNATSAWTGNQFQQTIDQTKFLLNNIGFVWTIRLPLESCPNVNFGFTYNKSVSFNRRYTGMMPLSGSLSELIASNANYYGYKPDDLAMGNNYNPYFDSNYDWLSILGYNSYLISPMGNQYIGQWAGETDATGNITSQTSGTGYFDVKESGGIDSYNIAFGGNIHNVVYWGMDFDIIHMNYNIDAFWDENLDNAYVGNNDGGIVRQNYSDWSLYNWYNCNGTGFNYKLGLIVKPIPELRLGFSFATPTWYNLTENYYADIQYLNGNKPLASQYDFFSTPTAYDNVNLRTPWKLNAGAALVLFNRLIVSADYEWNKYSTMKWSVPSSGGWYDPWTDNPWYDPWYSSTPDTRANYISNDPYYETNRNIQNYYKATNTFRIGAELRLTDRFSLRAGYSHVDSPVTSELKSDNDLIATAGTLPNYRVDNSTNYVTAGLGYNFDRFYIDAAYVYKHMDSEYHAYSPDPEILLPSPKSKLSLNNSQIVLSAGFKF